MEIAARANPHDYDLRALEVGEDLPRYNTWLLESFRPHLRGRVIEVGAGIGTIARRYVDDVDEAVLLEPAKVLFGPLREALGGKANVRLKNGTLEDVFGTNTDGADVTAGSFDTAVMMNVLEHISDDGGVLRLLHRLLKPGGALLIFVPAVPFLYGAIDARIGHVRRYTRTTLTAVVSNAGFAIETLRYFDILGMIPWFVTGRVLKTSHVSGGSARFYDRMIVPLCQLTDRLTRPRIGKNLVCIALKGGRRPT